MTLEVTGNQESHPNSADWEQLRSKLREVKVAHEEFSTQIPGYKKGYCIYEHFYRNEMLEVNNLLNRPTRSPAEAYHLCLEILTQIERYHRLFESNPLFAQKECSQMPQKYLSKLKSYLDQAEAELDKSSQT